MANSVITTVVAEITEFEAVDVVRVCIRCAIGAAIAYGAFSVFVLFCWQWLAAVLALVTSVFLERVTLQLADEQIDIAAKYTADAIVGAVGWLKGAFNKKGA